jgi:hypothetical protein
MTRRDLELLNSNSELDKLSNVSFVIEPMVFSSATERPFVTAAMRLTLPLTTAMMLFIYFFVSALVREREGGVKDAMHVAGVSRYTYWFARGGVESIFSSSERASWMFVHSALHNSLATIYQVFMRRI